LASGGWDYRTRILFTTELLLTAAHKIDQEVVFNLFSKSEIVAYYLNSLLSQNEGKSPEEWELTYSSGFGG
jgi:hypothetical protein